MTWGLLTLYLGIVFVGMDLALHIRLLTGSRKRPSDLVWMALAVIMFVTHVAFDVIG